MPDRAVLAHLLRRATFGPTAEEVDAAERAGAQATREALLRPSGVDAGARATPPPAFGADPYARITRASTREERQKAQQERRQQLQATVHWWLDRMRGRRPPAGREAGLLLARALGDQRAEGAIPRG